VIRQLKIFLKADRFIFLFGLAPACTGTQQKNHGKQKQMFKDLLQGPPPHLKSLESLTKNWK
jgi:hypothetical protein